MKNADAALASEYIHCLDGKTRELKISMLMMSLIQEHYRGNGKPEFKFFRDFDWAEHFDDPDKLALLVWAGVAHEERAEGILGEWTIEKCKEVVGFFEVDKIVETIQKAAIKSMSQDQVKALEAKVKKKKAPVAKPEKKKRGRPKKKA